MSEEQPKSRVPQILQAYRRDFQGISLRDLSPDGRITDALIEDVRAFKHHLLCVLAGVPDSDPRPMLKICRVGRDHYRHWRYDPKRDWVRCEICQTVAADKEGSDEPIS